MKQLFTTLSCSILLFFAQLPVSAQDTTQPGALKQINQGSEQADKIYGKEIQKQTLTKKSFEKLDTASNKGNKATKKYRKKCKRKHQ
jgi:hypothetical protein